MATRTGGPVVLWGRSYGANCAMGGAARTGFITGSDRPWNGFTAYSTAAVSTGQVLLLRTEQDGACVKPARQ